MRLLIVAPILTKKYASVFGNQQSNIGSWIDTTLDYIISNTEINIVYCVIKKNKSYNEVKRISENRIEFIEIKYKSKEYLDSVYKNIDYDVAHIFGIEHNYIPDFFQVIDYNKSLLHIQGIISVLAKHYLANYNQYNRVINFIFILYMNFYRRSLKRRGEFEILSIKKAKFVTGRTYFDYSFVKKHNNKATYFFNDEIMNRIFFENKWNGFDSGNQTIFISQMGYPIKAAHMALEIIEEVKIKYPNVICYVAGPNIIKNNSMPTRLHFSYSSFIKKLIHKKSLGNNIKFLGETKPDDLLEIMKKSSVCLIPSVVENSSNCLQESMLLGLPTVASFVGGMPSVAEHNKNCLFYPFDAPYLASSYIVDLFEDEALANRISENSYVDIRNRYAKFNPNENLIKIYQTIIDNNKL